MKKKRTEVVWDPIHAKVNYMEIDEESLSIHTPFSLKEEPLPNPSPQMSIQWGSGKPGENGSEEHERRLFKSFQAEYPQLYDPKILFVPFHHIAGPENDWVRFLRIYQPLTSQEIQLLQLEPHRPPQNLEAFYSTFEEADLIVFGSGVVEPFAQLLLSLQLDKKLSYWQKKGKFIYGYSAGTITIGEKFLHYFLGQEVLMHLYYAEQQSKETYQTLRKELCEHMDENILLEIDDLMEVIRIKGLNHPLESPLYKKSLGHMEAPTFKLLPNYMVLPHYGEYFFCTEDHLRVMTQEHPEWNCIGIPNGMALIHRREKDLIRTRVFGKNPKVSVTMIDQDGQTIEFEEGDTLPI
jgi:peptidase E